MKILIKVTSSILEKSKNCITEICTTNCAIAIAVREIFPKAEVRRTFIYPHTPEFYHSIDLPIEATRFINKFDSLDSKERVLMEPISFEIDVPNEVIESVGINQVYKILSESKTLEHVNV